MPKQSRRKFVRQAVATAGGVALVPAWLQASATGLGEFGTRRKLVVVQLSGGCDGLNVLAPCEHPRYADLRPGIGLKREEVLRIGSGLGWNPKLGPLAKLQDAGHLHVVQAVGYPNPYRSHFRSQDIWASAGIMDGGSHVGWLGQYLDTECPGSPSHHAIAMTDYVPLALRGQAFTGFAYGNLRRTQEHLSLIEQTPAGGSAAGLASDDYVTKVLTDTRGSAAYLRSIERTKRVGKSFPTSTIGRQLEEITNLMLADAHTDIYYATLTGFDTHAGQRRKHDGLLEDYGLAIEAFVRELQAARLFSDTLILTFSEFGRRAAQNKNAGTDHGKANLAWLIGGSVRAGDVADLVPDLNNLDDGDLAMRTDFRSIYATIVDRWLGGDADGLLRARYPRLNFL